MKIIVNNRQSADYNTPVAYSEAFQRVRGMCRSRTGQSTAQYHECFGVCPDLQYLYLPGRASLGQARGQTPSLHLVLHITPAYCPFQLVCLQCGGGDNSLIVEYIAGTFLSSPHAFAHVPEVSHNGVDHKTSREVHNQRALQLQYACPRRKLIGEWFRFVRPLKVGAEKDQVESWFLSHSLVNLTTLY